MDTGTVVVLVLFLYVVTIVLRIVLKYKKHKHDWYVLEERCTENPFIDRGKSILGWMDSSLRYIAVKKICLLCGEIDDGITRYEEKEKNRVLMEKGREQRAKELYEKYHK